ncbi:MAG: hypothetical protein ABI983_02680 [Acidobacteriota bacterium]
MMFRFALAVMLATGSIGIAIAQDPTQTLPNAYKVELDNNYVSVIRVHYDAGAQLPVHTHPAGTTAYVYLNDSEGVVFSHTDGNNRAITRAPVKAASIRLSGAHEEHHSAENTSAIASDFLRILLKTDTAGAESLSRRLSPTDTEFSNKQMRITRTSVAPGQKILVEAKDRPALRISVRPGVKELKTFPANTVRWLDKGTTEEFAVTGDFPIDVIKIDFLTKPKL